MSRSEPRTSFAPFVWGGLFLFCGIVLLLQVSGVLPWELWGTLWKFWPVLIILVGLSFLVPRRKAWLMAVLVLAFIGISLGIIITQAKPDLSGDVIQVEQYTVPLGDMKQADVTIDFSAGTIIMEEISEVNSSNLIEANPEVRNRHSTLEGSFNKTGDTGKLSLKAVNQEFWGRSGIRWELGFTRQVPLNFVLKFSAGRVNLDLEKLKVADIRLQMDACSGELKMPGTAGTTTVFIDMDVSNLDIIIPQGVAAKIQANASVSVFEVDKSRFPAEGGYFVSPDFESASNRVILNIVCDVSRLTIR